MWGKPLAGENIGHVRISARGYRKPGRRRAGGEAEGGVGGRESCGPALRRGLRGKSRGKLDECVCEARSSGNVQLEAVGPGW